MNEKHEQPQYQSCLGESEDGGPRDENDNNDDGRNYTQQGVATSAPAPVSEQLPGSNLMDQEKSGPRQEIHREATTNQRSDNQEEDTGDRPSGGETRRARKQKAREELDLLGKQPEDQPEELRIFAINVRGLRAAGKKEDLKFFLYDYDAHICVVTETHLLNSEAEDLQVPGYRVVHCDGCYTNKGGVLILARRRVSCRKLSGAPRPGGEVNACTCLVFPKQYEEEVVRLTGVYVPPSADATPAMLEKVVASEERTQNKAGVVEDHVLTGDFSQHTWAGRTDDLYHEWTGALGIWALSDPMSPTHIKGSALDKFLLQPGGNILEEFLPAPACDWSEEREGGAEPGVDPEWGGSEGFFPAHTFRRRIIADHHPVPLRIRGIREPTPPKAGTLNLAGMEPEDCQCYEGQISAYVAEKKEQIGAAHKNGNAANILKIIGAGIKTCLRDRMVRTSGAIVERDPFGAFCKRRKNDPRFPLLIKADIEGNDQMRHQVTQEMARDAWKSYLSHIKPPSISDIFTYLAKSEGRKQRAECHFCADPPLDNNGVLRFEGEEKCALLAD